MAGSSMADDAQTRGDAPRPRGKPPAPPQGKQDAPNYEERVDGVSALPVGDMNSANDE